MEIKELWRLPASSKETIDHVQFIDKPCDIMLENGIWRSYSIQLLFDYYENGKKYNSGILFDANQAYRYTSETLAKPLDGSLDTLVEYTNSEWLKELFKRNCEVAQSWKIRHLAICVNGYGMLEVIAQDYKILEAQEGELEK